MRLGGTEISAFHVIGGQPSDLHLHRLKAV